MISSLLCLTFSFPSSRVWNVRNKTFALIFPSDSPTNRLMKIVRLYTGADNESHFEDIEIALNPMGHMQASELQPTHGIMFRSSPPSHLSDYHRVPKRQYVITLSGQVEIETGDGAVRRFGPGDVMLAEDTTGRGHITRVVGNQPRHYVFIPLK
jgi:uncharacterized cupin superfamily protein